MGSSQLFITNNYYGNNILNLCVNKNRHGLYLHRILQVCRPFVTEYFHFSAQIIKHFIIEKVSGNFDPAAKSALLVPKDFKVRFVARKWTSSALLLKVNWAFDKNIRALKVRQLFVKFVRLGVLSLFMKIYVLKIEKNMTKY